MTASTQSAQPRMQLGRRHAAALAVGVLLALGALLRLSAYVGRGALWNDEAALAMNIVDRGWGEVARPFTHQQAGPYLFLIGQKLVTVVLGVSEHSLRLWSVLAGIALLPVLYALARELGGARAGLAALAASVAAPLLIEYSAELKPYGNDAFVSAALILLAARVLASAPPRSPAERAPAELAPLAIAGVVAPWLSLPSVFMLAAIGVALVAAALVQRRSLAHLAVLAALGATWGGSFAIHYVSFLDITASDVAAVQRYWAERQAFAPFPPRSVEDLRWYVGKFFYLFDLLVTPFGSGARYLAAALWLAGVWRLLAQRSPLVLVFLLPIPLVMGASAAEAYVFSHRLLLFLAAVMIVPCALGLGLLAELRPPGSRSLASVALLVLLVLELGGAAQRLTRPTPPSDIRSLVAHLRANLKLQDVIFVDGEVAWIYEYYARRAELDHPFLLTEPLNPDLHRAGKVIAAIEGAERVWAVTPTLGPAWSYNASAAPVLVEAERFVTEQLAERGRQLARYDGTNVQLYLYDLSQGPMSVPPP